MKFAPLVLLAAFFALALPAAAGPGGFKHSATKLTACSTEEHAATFTGIMDAFGRGRGLQMRFTLQSRNRTNRVWTPVEGAEGFDVWASAEPGIRRYISDKKVTALVGGTNYRAMVRFRWRSASGAIVARATRFTPACRQPDERANLKALRVRVSPGSAAGLRTYEVRLSNVGETDTPPSVMALEVNGQRVGDQTDAGLVAGGENDIDFEAAACRPGSQVVATVDVTAAVDESDETDNVLTVPCPAGAKRGRRVF